jgi:6-pyruvoyl-tetrahydropterin synthase
MLKMFVDQLTTIDFSYLDENFGILGESIIVDVELLGEVDNQGMLMDFSSVKKDIKKVIDQTLDHSLAIPLKNKHLTINNNKTEDKAEIEFLSNIGKITHISPKKALTFIEAKKIDIESIKHFLLKEVSKILPKNVKNINLTLQYEKNLNNNFIQYSHGLRKHEGNCQRIAHGHRSKIIITQNSERNYEIENWAKCFFENSYFIDQKDIKKQFSENNISYILLGYNSSQGNFTLTIPSKYCHITNNETTIENLAEFIHKKISEKLSSQSLKVKFFEGVNKGAIFEGC